MKKTAKKILRIIWLILGGLILIWTIFWFIEMKTISDFGIIVMAVMFAIGIYTLGLYLGITLIILIIKWIIKKFRK